MFHALALVEIKNGGPKHFLESLFQVTFIDSHFPAEFLDGNRFSDVLQQYFTCFGDLFTVCFIRQELAGKAFNLFFTYHALKAVQQQHLCLRIDVNVLQAVLVRMIQQRLNHHPDPAAKGNNFGKRRRMFELKDLVDD